MRVCGHKLPQRLVDALEEGEWPDQSSGPEAWEALGVEEPGGFLLLDREQMERQTQALVRHASHRAAEVLGLATSARSGFIDVNTVVAIGAGVNDELWVLSYRGGDEPAVLGSVPDEKDRIRFRRIADSFADLLTKLRGP